MKFSCIIVDDDYEGLNRLKDYIAEIPELILIKTYTNTILAASDILSGKGIDFAFLGTDMPNISGLELGQIIRPKVNHIIFTTGHTHHAFDAFEIYASGYLHKPINIAKLVPLVNYLILNKTNNPSSRQNLKEMIFIRSKEEKNKISAVKLEDIILIEVNKNYISIYAKNKTYISYLTLRQVEEQLFESGDFIKVNRSFIVAKTSIINIRGNLIELSNGKTINIGNAYKEQFFNYINKYMLKSSS